MLALAGGWAWQRAHRYDMVKVLTAIADVPGPTPLQQLLVTSLFTAMTGHEPDPSSTTSLDAEGLGQVLALRGEAYRRRILQVMALGALVVWIVSAIINSFKPRPRKLAGVNNRFAEE